MVIADGLALASYTRNLHHDGWMGSDTTLYILVYEPFRSITAQLWIPQDLEPRAVLMSSENWSARSELAPGEISDFVIPCSRPQRGLTLQVSIPGARSSSAQDQRVLGALLHSLTGVV